MPSNPIMILSYAVDPHGVLKCLQTLSPEATVEDGPDGWSVITIALKHRLLKKSSTISFKHLHEYYTGDDFPRHMLGIQGIFGQVPKQPSFPNICWLIHSFRFAITVTSEPPLNLQSSDPRLKYLYAVTKHLEAAMYEKSSLLDGQGRVLYSAIAKPDPKAIRPGIYLEAPQPSEMPMYRGGIAENPPSPPVRRIARRAMCLTSLAFRGMLERDPLGPGEFENIHGHQLIWVQDVEIASELEPQELQLLTRPLHSGFASEMTNAEWLVEAAAVMAWALGRLELPAYDEQVNADAVAAAVGFLSKSHAERFVAEAVLRPMSEILTLSKQLLAIHWRIREQRVRPRRRNFEVESQNAWFGSMPLRGIRFVDGDLAVGDKSIAETSKADAAMLETLTQQRHQAINWICGAAEIYSEVETQT